MSSYLQQLDHLANRIAQYNDPRKHDPYLDLLKEVAAVVREADTRGAPNLTEIVEKAGAIYDSAINWAYGDGDFDFLPSYAHTPDAPPIKDPLHRFGFGAGPAIELLRIIDSMRVNGAGPLSATQREEFVPPPWTKSQPPHPKSTRLSRFRDNVRPSATDATPLARTIYQARCEVASDSIPCPVNAAIASDSSVLAIAGKGGWKNRDPVLSLYLLDEGSAEQGGGPAGARSSQSLDWRCMNIDPGLSEVAYQIALDTPRKLALVADSHRIKSFCWGQSGGVEFEGWSPTQGNNVHTLDSDRYRGPLAVLPNGRVVRAGKGGFALWNIDELPTHKGGRRVGRGKYSDDSWRDNDNGEIERSTGTTPTTTVKFAGAGDETFAPDSWHLHDPSGHMLVGENGRDSAGRYGCYAIDLEQGGRKVARYLGHGGNAIEGFSTSAGDANVFATAGADGYARLYDVRHPLPVITIDSGKLSEFCTSVQLVHPDGIPTLFTGGDKSQSVRCWDIRAQAVVYELSTGNNSVCTLSWDAKRDVLYATTECDYMDRLGSTHGYRHARIPRWAQLCPEDHERENDGLEEEDVDMQDDEEYDGDEYDSMEDDDDENNWPKDAYHNETFFGYAYDAGEHVLLRYAFKEDPDLQELPEYGQASLDYDDGYW
ncbi:hypothetical protein BD309DRAFT_1080140 [Dichomitus squalens]|uniref:Uncharacterized protein n=1 Tax=Dichomitus squalens TaxID=114155 RepID=A0A4Q9NXF6_9APHY|nr:hypothetical protein BD309DRAFT_1080140 [Dichomitus squalens]TBU65222.1 hypothetical protein BD310DRAFT_866985 [Dichomitus squalens]